MLWVATTILALAPQGPVSRDRNGRIVLPPKVERPAQQDPRPASAKSARDGIQRRFHERVLELRRSRLLSSVTEQELLLRLGNDFDECSRRALQLARFADDDLMHGVLRVLAAYGGAAEAKELVFLLQTRSFGKATGTALETVRQIGRDQAHELLFDCMTASREPVRRHAADELAPLVGPADAQRLINLAGQGRADVRHRAVRLLGGIRTDDSLAFLVGALRDEDRVAVEACRALIEFGERSVEPLTAIVSKAAAGHSFGFAAFALASLEERAGRPFVSEAMRPHLLAELDMPDPFMRSVAAIALSGIAWRSSDTTGDVYRDHEIVERLIAVVAPREFVQHVALIQDLARLRLTRLTGQDFRLDHARWRAWWQNQREVEGYVAARQHLAVDAELARSAVITWRDGDEHIRLRGETIDPLPPSNDFVLDLLVVPEELAEVVQKLEHLGFMRGRLRRSNVPADGSLRLTVGGARCQTDPMIDREDLTSLGAEVRRAAFERRWQLYRDPDREPDVAAFWRAERRWLAAHPDPVARSKRLIDRIIGRLPHIAGARLDLAVEHLRGIDNLREALDGEHARELLAVVGARDVWDEVSVRLADVVLAAGEDAPWQALLEVTNARAGDGARAALSRLFGLLGPERVLDALTMDNIDVRIAAMDEVIAMRDVRAVPQLVDLLAAENNAVRVTAAFALGRLRAAAAREPMIEILANEGQAMSPHLRRTIWVALARIGGPEVFSVLSAAFYSPVEADRRAVLQAFAELRHPSAARELGNIFGLRGPDDRLGLMALQLLRGLGDQLGSPALRPQLESVNPEVRKEAAFTLAEFGDPDALPALIGLLDEAENSLRIVALIAGITGVDVTERNDRVPFLRRWMRAHPEPRQGQWLIESLSNLGVAHRLERDLLAAGSGNSQVPELTRLLVDAPRPWLRPLVARVLRLTTGEDFGHVTVETPDDVVAGIAERYRVLSDNDKAASGR